MTPIDTFSALMTERYSCRAFRPEPVARDLIERIVETACRAPSWCNAQPWQVVITEGDATDRLRAALLTHAKTHQGRPDLDPPEAYPGTYGERRRAVGWQLYDAVGVTKGDRVASQAQGMRNFALFDAPHVAILSSPQALGPYGAMDCGGFVLAFALAAKALGIDTIPQASLAYHADFLRDWFDIPADRIIPCAISFGYGDDAHPANGFRSPRAPVGDILEWRS